MPPRGSRSRQSSNLQAADQRKKEPQAKAEAPFPEPPAKPRPDISRHALPRQIGPSLPRQPRGFPLVGVEHEAAQETLRTCSAPADRANSSLSVDHLSTVIVIGDEGHQAFEAVGCGVASIY
jgi:hypothetical protein